MQAKLKLCLALHNHQPVGNFDDVIHKACRDSYFPFLDFFETSRDISISLHTSGALAVWLEKHYPEYLDRLRELSAEGRIEIIGGAFYEPILTMLPARDRKGQITRYSEWLAKRLDTQVRGMWIPERVWEPSLVSDLAAAGIEYTILDDYHFRSAGLAEDRLHGNWLTEDQGQLLRLFPGSEKLRYLIPFREPGETIDYLRNISESHPGTTVVFADDGEKFGTWPDTSKHVYERGWLKRFFAALSENSDWLECVTLRKALDESRPHGKVWLAEASYREMTEWVLPVESQLRYHELVHSLEKDERWPALQPFIRGGFWRNYRLRYPEADEMYARMMQVSNRLNPDNSSLLDPRIRDEATNHLYQAQCNCPWWHGAFGGIYLPHLRNETWRHLILADNLLDEEAGTRTARSVESADYNLDLCTEIRLANEHLIAWLQPAAGGLMYELDVRSIAHNLLATMPRRPEAYHQRVRAGVEEADGEAASIHDRVVFKQEGLDKRLQYDRYPRKSLLDHFWPDDCRIDDLVAGTAVEQGDFIEGIWESRIRRGPERDQVMMVRSGKAYGNDIRITKAITISSGTSLEMAWMLEGLPPKKSLRFGIEFNFAGMPAGYDDRYFSDIEGRPLGQLGEVLDLPDCRGIRLSDDWLRLDCRLTWDQSGDLWAHPVATVSQSEAGFELIHQSVSVQPAWHVRGDANGRWAVRLNLDIRTSIPQAGNSEPAACGKESIAGSSATC
jgi:4-alpha-glucanotransferase